MIISSFNNLEPVMKILSISPDKLPELATAMHRNLSEADPNYLEAILKESLNANFASLERGVIDNYVNYINLNLSYGYLQNLINKVLVLLNSCGQAGGLIADLRELETYCQQLQQSKELLEPMHIIGIYRWLLQSRPYYVLNFSEGLMSNQCTDSILTKR